MNPNIIIVMTDQQRADLRAARGYPLDTMPFLDSWASGGVDIERAYTPNPTCMPARVSMFTGRYPQCHRVRTNHNKEDAYYTKDLLDVLKEQGYRTALCGKNHSHRNPEDFDFHDCNGHLGNEENEDKTSEQIAFSEFLNSTMHMEIHEPSPGGIEVQHPWRNVTSALNFIDEVSNQSPFFVWMSFAEPHNPYQVPAPYFDMFPPEALPAIDTGIDDLVNKGSKFVWTRERWQEVMSEGDLEKRILRARSNYHGMLHLIDDQFKRLITGLTDRGIADNTIVVFLSDHGDFVGEYGLIRKGPDLPEVLTQIPMIWRGPGITPQGSRSKDFANIVDILPTICNMLDIETPFGCQGKSILPLLQNNNIPKGEFDTAYSESGFSGLYWTQEDELTPEAEGAMGNKNVIFDCLNTWSQCGQVRMVRKDDYKLQVDMMGTGYLYNLENDPREVHNLWNNPEVQCIKTEMLTIMVSEILKAGDPMPAPHNRYRTKLHPRGYWNQTYRSGDPGVRKI